MRSGTRFAGVFDQMLPHTPWKAVIEAAAAVREARADLIATVGGGSVMDGAKRCKLYPDAAVIVPPRSVVEILLRDLPVFLCAASARNWAAETDVVRANALLGFLLAGPRRAVVRTEEPPPTLRVA
jgi:hypothetical protein